MVEQVQIETVLKQEGYIFIDTRSPAEFMLDHLPNAINIPLFSNEERAVVGTLYKQVSRDKAIEQGIEYFSDKLPALLKLFEPYKTKKLVIYCWRGGMRSKVVASFLDSIGYQTVQLQGGYKTYREHVRNRLAALELPKTIFVVWGYTCTGKTALLAAFNHFIDLEGLAQHRSSVFGALGMQPRSQKMFENLLLQRLEGLQNADYLLFEGESRRIGDVLIPDKIWSTMRQGIAIHIVRNIDERVEACVQEYFISTEQSLTIAKIALTLKSKLSNEDQRNIQIAIVSEEYKKAAKILLEKYYDPLYAHAIKEYNFATVITNNIKNEGKKELELFIHKKKRS